MKRRNNFWDVSKCIEESKNHEKISHFQNNAPSAFGAAKRLGLLPQIREYYSKTWKRKGFGYWTFDRVKNEALKYMTKKEFRACNSSAYSVAKKKGFLPIVSAHMTPLASLKRRAIYAFEFSDKSVYVGLTFNYKKRYLDHIRDTVSIKNKVRDCGHVFVMFNNWDVPKVTAKSEIEIIAEYRKNGWTLLNQRKGGGLGGSQIKWTMEKLQDVVSKYSNRRDFRKGCPSAYSTLVKKKMLHTVCKDMPLR